MEDPPLCSPTEPTEPSCEKVAAVDALGEKANVGLSSQQVLPAHETVAAVDALGDKADVDLSSQRVLLPAHPWAEDLPEVAVRVGARDGAST